MRGAPASQRKRPITSTTATYVHSITPLTLRLSH
ncbi:hypothetical protein E2C01_083824 [Portunus trituberculatus]|uniref:Uncharacterized protein n=1 Tax=Portunus trituberculatus TaxID=210409 RepID=A0A5B7IW71_PORTR|nr:hypothetical protein [Portunus trituberculatus]